MNKQNQNGSVHLLVTGIIVVAILSAVGFLFWNNFVKSDEQSVKDRTSNTTEEPKNANKADPYRDWKTYTSSRDGYSIKYPANWFLMAETDNDGPYIRNFDPANNSEGPRDGEHSGYPKGAKYVRVLLDKGNITKGTSNMTTTEWYNSLGKSKLQDGPIAYLPEEVKELQVNNLQAKSAKASFTETDESIFLLHGTDLYNLSLYPYSVSSDEEMKLILNSFVYL